ncbi:MAG: sigma factor [Desulfotomaculaceae bacterium]|nr:sigma factor [Desulfotomaculaceae bacterium]
MINESQCTATAELVVKKYADMVYRLAFAQVRSKSDTDDIFQEVFLRYVQSKPIFENEEHRLVPFFLFEQLFHA